MTNSASNARNAGLTADPVFVGATRPPMRWGVTYSALLFNLVFTIAQVSTTYGTGEAQTIVENCANTLILRCSGSEHGGTSQFASRLIGEREVIRQQTSRGRDCDSWLHSRGARRSTSVSEQHVIEAAVLPSQLEQLPDCTGYLKTASSQDWLRVSFRRGM